MVEYINGKKVVDGYTEGARAYNSGAISVDHDTATKLTFDSERYDTDSIHNTSTNTGRLTCNTAGKYLIVCNVQFGFDGDGYRLVNILLNNTDIIGRAADDTAATLSPGFEVSTIWDMTVGDYVEVQVTHTAGAAIDIAATAKYSPEFMMQKIG